MGNGLSCRLTSSRRRTPGREMARWRLECKNGGRERVGGVYTAVAQDAKNGNPGLMRSSSVNLLLTYNRVAWM
jgi:hypothetical protein